MNRATRPEDAAGPLPRLLADLPAGLGRTRTAELLLETIRGSVLPRPLAGERAAVRAGLQAAARVQPPEDLPRPRPISDYPWALRA